MQKKLKENKFIKYFFRCMVVSVFLYFILGEIFLPADSPQNNFSCEQLPVEWTLTREDGSSQVITIPGEYEVDRGEWITMSAVLPEDISDNMYLCFRSGKQDMEFYIDGKLRASYSTADTRIFGQASAVSYVFVEVCQEDAGKELVERACTSTLYAGAFYPVYYGERAGIWGMFLKEYSGELLLALIAGILGLFVILISIILSFYYHETIDIEYLGWGVLLTSVWLVANSVLRQLFFPSISVINDIAFYMVMLMPIAFAVFMDRVQSRQYHLFYFIVEILAVVNFVVCTILHMTGVRDFADTIYLMAVVLMLTVLLIFATIIIDIFKKRLKNYFLISLGLMGAAGAAVLQVILYFKREMQFNGIIISIGLIFLLAVASISALRTILHWEREKRRALEDSEEKSRFVARMSHEIRTPIYAVLGLNEMVMRESKEKEIRTYSLKIQNAGQALLGIINDILDISKITSGKMRIVPVEYELGRMVASIYDAVLIRAKEKNLKFKVILEPDLPCKLYGDDNRIRQVLNNLLSNAVKYTEKGMVSMIIYGDVSGDTVDLHISVEDTGIGMKQEELGKLFLEFERLDEERNRGIEGTGLGMSIAWNLLSMMGSTLKVESIYGSGSRFYFDLKQKIVDASPVGNVGEHLSEYAEKYEYHVKFTAPGAHVLIVDDTSLNLYVIKNLLKKTRMRITTAESGKECLKLVREQHFDLIFLDAMMPEMDGIETLQHMQELPDSLCKGVPVFALTADVFSGAEQYYRSKGFDGYLPKPVEQSVLEQTIMDHLPSSLLDVVWNSEEAAGGNGEVAAAEEQIDLTEELPFIGGVDWNYGQSHFQTRRQMFAQIRGFQENIDTYLLQLKRERTEENTLGTTLEQLQNDAGLTGAVTVYGLAKLLLHLIEIENDQDAERLLEGLIEELEDLRTKLLPLIEKLPG